MYRIALEELDNWKADLHRKPLIIRGARQVGKTWLMKEFGKKRYEDVVYANFEGNSTLFNLFAQDFHIPRILKGLEIYSDKKISPERTLIIFDEIQECPKALNSLKYFQENAPEQHIIAAGSLLGIGLHKDASFPVGKTDFLHLNPLSYKEFLMALGKKSLAELLITWNTSMITAFKTEFIEMLKRYYVTGGMPEAVAFFREDQDFTAIRKIQQRILDGYEQDFSKHAPHEIVPRIRMLWNSLPSQLAREHRKFMYGLIKDGARAREYETAMLWLTDSSLISRVHRITAPRIPLKAYEDVKAFKLFPLDVGLLSCMTGLNIKNILEPDKLFVELKGALTEQFAFQELKTLKNTPVYYWSNPKGHGEVDFVLQWENGIIPLEVKAETNLQAKSLRVFRDLYQPRISLRSSLADYKKEGWLINLPLYGISGIHNVLET